VDELAPFCPSVALGIVSKYTIEGFSYSTLISDDADDVGGCVVVNVDNDVYEYVYDKLLSLPSQFMVFDMNAFTTCTSDSDDRKML
jgi:hypothetical protein